MEERVGYMSTQPGVELTEEQKSAIELVASMTPEQRLGVYLKRQQELDAIPPDEKSLEEQREAKSNMDTISQVLKKMGRQRTRRLTPKKFKYSSKLKARLKS